jgi:hypothetical protein
MENTTKLEASIKDPGFGDGDLKYDLVYPDRRETGKTAGWP